MKVWRGSGGDGDWKWERSKLVIHSAGGSREISEVGDGLGDGEECFR